MTLSRKARLERQLASIRAKKDDALKLAARLGLEEERLEAALKELRTRIHEPSAAERRYRERGKATEADSGRGNGNSAAFPAADGDCGPPAIPGHGREG